MGPTWGQQVPGGPHESCFLGQYGPELRFKIIYFLMGPWDPQVMIIMGPRALEMGPIIDVFIH